MTTTTERRRLFSAPPPPEADVRPTLIGVVTLMFLLLFFLLTTTSGVKLGAISLRLSAPDAAIPLPHSGTLRDLTVRAAPDRLLLTFETQTTDIAAASTATETHRREIPHRPHPTLGPTPDLAALSALLLDLHRLDPAQQRARLLPHPDLPTADLLALMDALRGPDQAPLFPKIVLGSEPSPP